MSDFPHQGRSQSNRSFLREISRWQRDNERRAHDGPNRWERDCLEVAKCKYAAGVICREEFLSIKESLT